METVLETPKVNANGAVHNGRGGKKLHVGGSFIVKNTAANSVFIPEEWDEEQRMIYDMAMDFVKKEIHPNIELIDSMKDPELMPKLLEKAGELGMCSMSIPQEYDGMGLDFNTGLLFGEAVAAGFSFATAIGAQTSIGSLPILYYGNEAQKKKYLPKLGTAELKASYCLTEPNAGSDANSGKTKAVLNKKGTHYIINGQKMWITNGGFADIFIVFAKIDDDKNLSAFIVEKEFGGIELGAEEKKLGIKGSSTVQVFFNNCPVPVENLLGKREEGFKIALNILNTGRIKLAVGSVGGSKIALDQSLKYANERKQFGKSIGDFGAIKFKLAEMAHRTFASESASYRVGKYIDENYDALLSQGIDRNEARLKALREFAIECAIMKVHGSEVLAYCTDECIQIFGGMGYSVETGAERGYRDARITRIYEGTNEINRMLSVGELFKRSLKNKRFDMIKALKENPKNLAKAWIPFGKKEDKFSNEKYAINKLKYAYLLLAMRAAQKLKLKLEDEQEVIINFANILGEVFVAESVWLRVEKLWQNPNIRNTKEYKVKREMAKVYLYEAIRKVRANGEEAIMSFASGVEKRALLTTFRGLTGNYDINPTQSRRRIANYFLAKNGYKA